MITQKEKVLWEISCQYKEIPETRWFVLVNKYDYSTPEYKVIGPEKIWSSRRSNKQWDFLHSQYYYCSQVLEIIDLSFDDFVKKITGGYDKIYNSPYYRRWGRWRRHRRPAGRLKYQRKSHHKKKELSDHCLAKKEWREEKKVRKDRSRYHGRFGGSRCKTYYKRFSNKMHRREEKNLLGQLNAQAYYRGYWEDTENHWEYIYPNNDWDKFYIEDYRYYLDPWLWD